MSFRIHLSDIQHIKNASFSLEMGKNKLICLVGKNGIGKTTLIKSIRNIIYTDTFIKTSSEYIFTENSKIEYQIKDINYNFNYEPNLRFLNCKDLIDENVKNIVDVELAAPHGNRFNFFQNISRLDRIIRKAIVLKDYLSPSNLIHFLNSVYSTNKFDNLVQIKIKNSFYYCLVLSNYRYIREDYFSSGEYFLINLYKKIENNCKCIFIDEIDISLDAAAQVKLISFLRNYCEEKQINIIFTTHSLALMKTLQDDELFYLSNIEENLVVENKSFNYIKSILFGFKGWDKYILTEDKILKNFLIYLIGLHCKNTFYEYQIIYIGGAKNVVDLMERNSNEEFFSDSRNVITVLDGDQRNYGYVQNKNNIHFLPFESVEKALLEKYNQNKKLLPTFPEYIDPNFTNGKKLVTQFKNLKLMSENDIFAFLYSEYEQELEGLCNQLKVFLISRDNI